MGGPEFSLARQYKLFCIDILTNSQVVVVCKLTLVFSLGKTDQLVVKTQPDITYFFDFLFQAAQDKKSTNWF